jgi:diadenosine tetraphosphate (Ap4A) HIT family hydrolase
MGPLGRYARKDDAQKMFALHPRLEQETLTVGDFPLCRLLLMNDANYPWFILVPRRPGIREIFELTDRDQQQLIRESSQLSRALIGLFHADKLNIAALGNKVPQLHIHHVVRYQTDRAWPNPVWGLFSAKPYAASTRPRICAHLLDHLIDFTPVQEITQAPGTC